MKRNHENSPEFLGRNKGTKKLSEAARIFQAIYNEPKTMRMIEQETGIRIPNICRRIADLKKNDSVKVARKGICPISHYSGVQFLTSNPAFFPKEDNLQLKLNFNETAV